MTSKLQLTALLVSTGAFATLLAAPRSDAAAPSLPAPATAPAPAMQAGNPATGAKLFLQCRACHTVNPGGANTVGPNLAGIMGAKAATRPGYAYSPALKNAKLTWDKPTMDAWLTRPAKVAPGNKMAFAGMSNPQARADMIAYLATLKGK
ncbi:cytochrome c family protein [Sphingomonas sp. HF-S3]|uniref:Cytochrome c family protein n=1 Tax=Sphingomonas rustica TaxID=3103142 RepID=A0ABV0B2L2_9SPHN